MPRPPIAWVSIGLIGSTLFTGQFLLIFFAFTQGLPPGLASVTQQMQAFFTVLLAALFLRDIPGRRQVIGLAMALAGLAVIGSTLGADLTATGLGLGVGAALSWAIGNVLVKRVAGAGMFPLVVWCSLVPPVPAMLVSIVNDRDRTLLEAVLGASWLGLGAVLYLAALATVVAYASWGYLLRRYPSGVVAPFALLAPCTGVVSSAVVFGEAFTPIRFVGMGLILGGVAVVVLPATRLAQPGGPGEVAMIDTALPRVLSLRHPRRHAHR